MQRVELNVRKRKRLDCVQTVSRELKKYLFQWRKYSFCYCNVGYECQGDSGIPFPTKVRE
jgi:hypothetical protein